MIAAYPLQWPTGWKRTDNWTRRSANFKRDRQRLSVTDGVRRVQRELDALFVHNVVISTHIRTRADGLPRSGERKPDDPGAAVYWEDRAGNNRVMAIDHYDEVADNLAAIAATLEAMRAIDRHGGAAILDRAFTGFVALPAPGAKKSWRDVLDYHGPLEERGIGRAYRSKAAEYHPDRPGGSHDRMAELNRARDEAMREIGP